MDSEYIINHIDGFISYIWSIDWRDPWLMGLLAFHVIITLMALLTRNYGNFQVVLFLVLLLLVYFSESINEIASNNWRLFSRQQYFDSKGLFISIVFSIPILLNCMLMVFAHFLPHDLFQDITTENETITAQSVIGSWLWQSTQLMTNLKRAQLREKIKRESSRHEIKED